MTGTIKNIMLDKRFGFIKGENGVEYFFHANSLKNVDISELTRGQDVTFEESEGTKGPRAEDVFV